MSNLHVDPKRTHVDESTGIYVRAMLDEKWGNWDIATLNRGSLWDWLHSRNNADWPANCVLSLLGHDPMIPQGSTDTEASTTGDQDDKSRL